MCYDDHFYCETCNAHAAGCWCFEVWPEPPDPDSECMVAASDNDWKHPS